MRLRFCGHFCQPTGAVGGLFPLRTAHNLHCSNGPHVCFWRTKPQLRFRCQTFPLSCSPSLNIIRRLSFRFTDVLFSSFYLQRAFLFFLSSFFLFCFLFPLSRGKIFKVSSSHFFSCFLHSFVILGTSLLQLQHPPCGSFCSIALGTMWGTHVEFW